MPYIKQADREAIEVNVSGLQSYGEMNYLITKVLLQTFQNCPKYETIHVLRRDFVVDPKHNELLNQLRSDFADKFTVADIYAAAAEAFHEFRDRVGKLYEAGKCLENGDLPEYEALIGPLLQKIGELKNASKPSTSLLILPGNETK